MLRHFENSWLFYGFGFYAKGTWGHENKNALSGSKRTSKIWSTNMKMLSTGGGM
jgi:hypothetical protein